MTKNSNQIKHPIQHQTKNKHCSTDQKHNNYVMKSKWKFTKYNMSHIKPKPFRNCLL